MRGLLFPQFLCAWALNARMFFVELCSSNCCVGREGGERDLLPDLRHENLVRVIIEDDSTSIHDREFMGSPPAITVCSIAGHTGLIVNDGTRAKFLCEPVGDGALADIRPVCNPDIITSVGKAGVSRATLAGHCDCGSGCAACRRSRSTERPPW